MISRIARFALIVCVAIPATLSAQSSALVSFDAPARGAAEWRTLETEHFTFHYRAEFEEWTRSVAVRMESVREAVRAYIGYAPGPRVTILVDDPRNETNGNAISWLDKPQIQLFPVPPGPRSFGTLRSWGELLAVHEFGHIAHLSRPSRGMSRLQRLIPAVLRTGPLSEGLPRWAKEGYATVVEGALTGTGRPVSAMRAAVLRQFAVDGLLPTYGAIDGTTGFYGGSFAYLLGSAFLEHMAATHGDSTLPQLWRRMSAVTSRSFTTAFEQTFAVRPADAYARYVAGLTANAVNIERALDEAGRVDGTLEITGTGSLGDPAVSPDGEKVAVTLPSEDGAQGRVVIWPATRSPAHQRDSARQATAERLRRADSLDVPPVELPPRGRRVLASLSPARGFPYRNPRFLPDNERLLVIRSDLRADGSVLPDLFLWHSGTGDVRRVTDGEAIREADPFPDGARAAGLRCVAGHCDVVVVTLASGEVRTLRAGSPLVQYSRPRVSPDGRRIAASELQDGVWRAVLIDAATGEVSPVGPVDASNRYDLVWTRDGASLLAVTDASGVPNVEQIDVASGRTTPLTRVFGAAFAPEPMAADSGFLFLSLTGRGFDLRRLLPDTTRDAAGVPGGFYNLQNGAVVMQPAFSTAPFDSADVGEPRRYGLGPQRLAWMPMAGGSIGGGYVGLALSGSDPNERFSWMLQHSWRHDRPSNSGSALSSVLRLPGVELAAEVNRTRVFASRWTGGAVSASHARFDAFGATGLRVGYAHHEVEPEWADESDSRGYVWGALQRTLTVTGGRGALVLDVRGLASRTMHGPDAAEDADHRVGSATLALRVRNGPSLEWETTAGRVEDGTTADRFALGGLGMRAINPAVVPQSVAVPWLEAGAIGGASFTQHVARAGAPGSEVFAWAVRTDAGEWHRAAGIEARLYEGANGFARLPGASLTAGAAWLFDPPNADRVRVWAGMSFRP